MQAQLLHLSGPLRGRTETYPRPQVLIGTAADADVRFPAGGSVKERHAEVAFTQEECAFHLRRLDGQVFVNGQEVEEVILEHGDLLELGPDGPRARFRIHVEPGSFCKPVRRMLADAQDVARESGTGAGTKTLVRDLFTHASPRLKFGFPVFVVLLALGAAYVGGLLSRSSGDDRQTLERLRRLLEEFKGVSKTMVSRQEIEQMRAEFARHDQVIERVVSAEGALRQVLDVYSKGVCLIHGQFGFVKEVDGKEEFLRDDDGDRMVAEYCGSAFLVSADGKLLTNHHVAEPWWHSEEVAPLIAVGLRPRFIRLDACFPNADPIAVDPATVKLRSDEIDVALMRVPAEQVKDVPVLPLSDEDPAKLRGQKVIVLGYPTGINALLAKADAEVVREVTAKAKGMTAVIAELARRKAITPVATQGALNELTGTQLIYDATTTSGGSGGPVFGVGGKVIGINFAILHGFAGSNFGVPIRFGVELLK